MNLSGAEAVEKIKKLTDNKTIMFCTFTGQQMTTRPMHVQGIDEDGTFWFFSDKDSDKNQHISTNPKVQLIYADNSGYEYLCVDGAASIEHDPLKIASLWSDWAKNWFQGGQSDPNLTLLRVTPADGHYWDTKNNKVISLMKIAVGALTGKTTDNGLEGDLRP